MEVLVIGAGAAGLAAAETLCSANVKVRILEARNRIGGRIETVRDPDLPIPIELGAEFTHGRPGEIFEIARATSLSIAEVTAKHRHLQNGRLRERYDLLSKIDEIFERMSDPALPDETFAEFATRTAADPEVRAWATAYVEGFNAARADRISTRALVQEMQASDAIDGERSFRIAEGYDRVAQRLYERCTSQGAICQLNSVVSGVRWRRGRVEVAVQSSSGNSHAFFSADQVVVTVPLGVLQAPENARGTIHFDPPLAGLREALAHLQMGAAMRITFRFRNSFVKQRRQLFEPGFIHSGDEGFPTWWTTLAAAAPGSAPIPALTAWAGGPKAERLSGLGDELVAGVAIDSLSRILAVKRDSIAPQVKRWYLHNWCRDPFARGAYSYAGVGGLEARRTLAAPVEETLYFAGEATETEGHPATVHGAIASGRRAARQILGVSLPE